MAKKSGLAQQFFVGGYDLSGDIGALEECSSPRPVLDANALNASAMERIIGLGDGAMGFMTFFNDAAGQQHLALRALPAADTILTWVFGATLGDVACTLMAKRLSYDWKRNQDKSLVGNVKGEANSVALEWWKTITPGKVTHRGATTGASVDDGAAAVQAQRERAAQDEED